MKIDSYDFGQIVINGKEYDLDVVVFPEKVDYWTRRESHLLRVEDVWEIVKERPHILVVGTGYSGVMKIKEEVREFLKKNGVKLIEKKSREAVETYNRLVEKEKNKKVVLAIHLTC